MNSYPGKILLFGEYTLLFSQQALAMPFPKYSGHWNYDSKPKGSPDLTPWLQYINELDKGKTRWITTDVQENFKNDLTQGLWFDSNIPQGYGLGSSGALVAAWYAKYIEEKSDASLAELKHRFSLLESFFHGTSSGFDPLVSYLNQPILQQGNTLKLLDSIPEQITSNFFIIDTLVPRSTEPLVKWFKEKIEEDQAFKKVVKSELVKAQGFAIEAYISGNYIDLKNAIKKISEIQFRILKKLIPDHLLAPWKAGLESQNYFLKLCGAGGGGAMLGFGRSPEIDLEIFSLAD